MLEYQAVIIGEEVIVQPTPWKGRVEDYNPESDEVFVKCSGCEGCNGHWMLAREIIPDLV